jgi:O-antigen ligase
VTALSVKALIVVIAIAAIVFRLGRPIALRFSNERDFYRRRNIWFVLTIVAFLSPSFWLFALVAIPLLFWAGRKDSNPVALYLLLFQVIPDINVEIPVVGINELFSLTMYRLLAFCVLIPVAWKIRRSAYPVLNRGLTTMDLLLLAFGALQIALFAPYESPTNTLRRTFLFFLDVYALYFVISRFCASRRMIVDALAAFCMSCALMAALAVFESLRHWWLYTDIAIRWSSEPVHFGYLIRGGALRAQVSAGHALALGLLLANACAFWLYLQSHVNLKRWRFAVVLLMWAGLLATISRGPWLGAIVVYFSCALLGPRALSRSFKAIAVAVIVVIAIGLSPLGDKIKDVVPFLGGSTDNQTYIYRRQFAARSWELIQNNPFFGDQFAQLKMEDLRQGEGIIDFINTYAMVALYNGFVGLTLFIGFILVALSRAYGATRRAVRTDADLALLGACLIAATLGTLLMLSGISFIQGPQKMFYILAALAAAYAHIGRATQQRPASYARTNTSIGRR